MRVERVELITGSARWDASCLVEFAPVDVACLLRVSDRRQQAKRIPRPEARSESGRSSSVSYLYQRPPLITVQGRMAERRFEENLVGNTWPMWRGMPVER